MLKRSSKAAKKRADERNCLLTFFARNVIKIRAEGIVCENCKSKLRGSVSEVAHILPKQRFKTVMCNDKNVVFLCDRFNNNCHGDFDNNSSDFVQKMQVFELARERLQVLLEEEEDIKIGPKLTDKYKL